MSSTPKVLNVLEALCYHDSRNPNCYDHLLDEKDRQEPRGDCGCDNCFYGRDQLALEILRLQGIAVTLANEGRIPDGWKLMPIEPTDAMLDCFPYSYHSNIQILGQMERRHLYVKMIAAAPSPEDKT